MQNAIWLSWIVGTLALFAARPRWGALAYLVAVLLCPYGVFSGGNLLIRADLVLTPLMLACQVLGISRTTGRFSLIPIIWLFALWLVWTGMTTLGSERGFYFVAAYGYIRVVIVMVIFSWIPWREQDLHNYQFVYVLTSIPIGILAVGQVLNVHVLRALADAWYSPYSAVVMAMQTEAEEVGYVYRAVGVFGNVSPAATYFLLVACLSISLYNSTFMRGRRRWLALALVATIIGGLATLSATFVGGISLAVLIAVLNADSHRRKNLLAASAGCVVLLAITVYFARSNIDAVDAVLDYQWQRLTGGELLAGRYSIDEGVTADALDELRAHPFMGAGWTLSDAFSGDSIYVAVLYCSGVVGSALFTAGIACLTAACKGRRCGHWALSWTAIMLLGGIGCTTLLSGRLADGWWAMQGMLISQLVARPHRQQAAAGQRTRRSVSLVSARPEERAYHAASSRSAADNLAAPREAVA